MATIELKGATGKALTAAVTSMLELEAQNKKKRSDNAKETSERNGKLHCAASAHYLAMKGTFNADDMLAVIHGDDLPTGRTLITARGNWNNVFKATAARGKPITMDYWKATGAKEIGNKRTFLAWCTYMQANPQATVEQIKAAKVKPVTERTAGDAFKAAFDAFGELGHPTEGLDLQAFADLLPHIKAIAAYVAAGKKEGKFLTSKELAERAKADPIAAALAAAGSSATIN